VEIACPFCGKTLVEKEKLDKPLNLLIAYKIAEMWEKMRSWICEDCKVVIMKMEVK